jgi:phosphohistidine phosphatase
MKVIVARHGKAHKDSPTGDDADRLLKDRGEAQAQFLGLALAGLPDPPRRIVTSPYARARQTAELMNHTLRQTLIEDKRLAVGAPVSDILDVLRDHADAGPVCVVGHNPWCEALVAALTEGCLCGQEREGAQPHRTGEAVVLDLPDDALANGDDPLGLARVVARVRLAD